MKDIYLQAGYFVSELETKKCNNVKYVKFFKIHRGFARNARALGLPRSSAHLNDSSGSSPFNIFLLSGEFILTFSTSIILKPFFKVKFIECRSFNQFLIF